jgi:hypothetical protein
VGTQRVDRAEQIELLRRVARLLDSAIEIPGTSFRIGLDPILGLVPGIGDLISPLFTVILLWRAREMGIPRVVQLRMIVNVAIDTLAGAVPVLGDVFDFAWKANNRNLALLEKHAGAPRRASAGDWLFAAAVLLLLAAIVALPLVLVGWLLSVLAGYFLRA